MLPQNYELPKSTSSGYMKLQDGENRFRVLSEAIVGWEDWQDKKPLRFQLHEKPLKPIDDKKPVKHFWAFIVWNVLEEKIQILQITQKSIQKKIEELLKDEDWGSPLHYDIKISRKGEGIDTEYNINPAPHKPLSNEILQAFKDKPINLEALFYGLDPFNMGEETPTPLMKDVKEEKIVPLPAKKITDEQGIELSELVNKMSEDSQAKFATYIKETFGIDKIYELLAIDYDKVKLKLIAKLK